MSELRNPFTIRYYMHGKDVMTENAETFASALVGGKTWLDLAAPLDRPGFEITLTGKPSAEFSFGANR